LTCRAAFAVDGEIKFVKYHKGKFLDARNINASLENEKPRDWDCRRGRVSRDSAANCRVDRAPHRGLGRHRRKTGAWGTPGDDPVRVARELYLPPGTQVTAKVGDYAKAVRQSLPDENDILPAPWTPLKPPVSAGR